MATMDAKALHTTGKQIQKAIESGDSGESLLNILQPSSSPSPDLHPAHTSSTTTEIGR